MTSEKEAAAQSDLQEHDTETRGNMQGGAPYLPEDKFGLSPLEAQERYGESKTPVVADEAWVAPIANFSKKDTRAEKWVLVNYNRKENGGNGIGTMTFINTFDGFAGSNFKQDAATQPLDPKKFRSKTGQHKKVAVDDCPVACTHEEAKAHKVDKAPNSIAMIAPGDEEIGTNAESAVATGKGSNK